MELDESTQDKFYELLYESDSDSSSSDKSENSSGYISDNNIEITNNCANCPDGIALVVMMNFIDYSLR